MFAPDDKLLFAVVILLVIVAVLVHQQRAPDPDADDAKDGFTGNFFLDSASPPSDNGDIMSDLLRQQYAAVSDSSCYQQTPLPCGALNGIGCGGNCPATPGIPGSACSASRTPRQRGAPSGGRIPSIRPWSATLSAPRWAHSSTSRRHRHMRAA